MYRTSRAPFWLLLILITVGTLGYTLIEHWSILDSLYMTVITLSTVGFREIAPLSPAGKLFTASIIIIGVGTLAFTLTKTTEALLEGSSLRRRRMKRMNQKLRDHVIVCGFGRMGRTICEQLKSRNIPMVVIERSPELQVQLEQAGINHVIGDATDDESLTEARIDRAHSLATVLPTDAENLFVTLSARAINAKLTIISWASRDKNEAKILSAGATRVLNPYRQTGQLMVRQLLQPAVTAFFDAISEDGGSDLNLEEIQIQPGSSLSGVMLRDSPIRKELDVIVVGVRNREGTLKFNPAPDLTPQAGDTLVALGEWESLQKLDHLAQPNGK
jgi:voltage-gated potassium channel